ncbi:MAG: nuclear transport factor 2 family protein [Candidatus Obscuribacterales bacterium]|nr:nuclear transport factor 2 family protein [Candidatus Obscuribacterales bacterium]
MNLPNLSRLLTLVFFASQCANFAPAIANAKKEAELPPCQESSSITSSTNCKINCIDPHAACAESEKLIEDVKLMYKAYSEEDLTTLGSYLDENCTSVDEGDHKMLTGKKAVLADIKATMEKAKETESKLLSYTIDNPYAEVEPDGKTAIVTFEAIKTFGGKNPHTISSRCTDIFRKENGKWLRMHYRSFWQPSKT